MSPTNGRAVWVVAGLAGNAARVVCRINLRKSLGLGRARRVAPRAQHAVSGFTGVTEWIVGMVRQRPVAGLAVHMRMLCPSIFMSAISVWQLSQVWCPANFTGCAAISPIAAPR